MPHGTTRTTPTEPTDDVGETAAPRSAAEHCAAAEELFAHARALHPGNGSARIPAEAALEAERCLEWAGMHLRLAEAITAGAGLVVAHRQLLANPDVRLRNTPASYEARAWTALFEDQRDKTGRSA